LGAILYDEEGRALGVGQELTVSAAEAKSLQEAGTVEAVRETAEVEPDETQAAGKPRPRSVVKRSSRKR
jgi:hypothetical protein